MKNLVKSTFIVLLSVITIGTLASCNDDSSEVAPVEPQEPRMVSLGFEGFSLEPSSGPQAKAETIHNYVTTGYTVTITGGISPEYAENLDVDLEAGLSVEVVGDIQVTVSHPNFDGAILDVVAYYGAQSVAVPTASSDTHQIPTELVQGFIVVTEEAGLEGVITDVTIMGQSAVKNKAYYTAVQEEIPVVVATVGNTLYGQTMNTIGGGVQYTVTSDSEMITFILPEFGEPIDGGLTPIPPVQ